MLCPLPGKCMHDEFIRTGVHFCSAPRCPHARLVRMALGAVSYTHLDVYKRQKTGRLTM